MVKKSNKKQNRSHNHDMKLDGDHYKCASCEFKCTVGIVTNVMKYPNSHRIIRKSDPKADLIYNG